MTILKRSKYNLPEGSFIGVLSDTHIPTRANSMPASLFRVLDGAGLIIHAGDLVEEEVLWELQSLAPVEAVAGNMDPWPLHRELGEQKIVEVEGFNIAIVHGRNGTGDEGDLAYRSFSHVKDNLNAVIFGHSHCHYLKSKESVLLLNPGSPVEPRRGSRPSCARITIADGVLQGEIVFV